jgi:hypothetical protein
LLWVKARLLLRFFFIFFLLKTLFKNLMEYAFYETTIGVKWECVWNGIILSNFQSITEFRK